MKVSVSWSSARAEIVFTYSFESSDKKSYKTQEGKSVKKARESCVYKLPGDFSFDDLHKDRLALVALLNIYSFVGSRFEVDFPVSKDLKDVFATSLSIKLVSPKELEETEEGLEETGRKSGIALSMGVDSTAGLAIMPPEETVAVFLDRIYPLKSEKFYKKDNIYDSLRKIPHSETYIVRTDMEYLRSHRGFVMDIGVGCPLILLSNHANLRSVNYGYSLHHLSHYGENSLRGFCTGDYCRFDYWGWREVFRTCGLFLSFITAGLTEIGTQIVVSNSPYKGLESACMRGKLNKECLKCKKCYRKVLFRDFLKFGIPDHPKSNYAKLSKLPQHKLKYILDPETTSLTMLYAYILKNYKGKTPILREIKKHYDGKIRKRHIELLDKWFDGANQIVDPFILEYAKQKAEKLLKL